MTDMRVIYKATIIIVPIIHKSLLQYTVRYRPSNCLVNKAQTNFHKIIQDLQTIYIVYKVSRDFDRPITIALVM